MTKGELIEFLEPFSDEVELYTWDQGYGVWRPVKAQAEQSNRTGKISIWLEPLRPEQNQL